MTINAAAALGIERESRINRRGQARRPRRMAARLVHAAALLAGCQPRPDGDQEGPRRLRRSATMTDRARFAVAFVAGIMLALLGLISGFIVILAVLVAIVLTLVNFGRWAFAGVATSAGLTWAVMFCARCRELRGVQINRVAPPRSTSCHTSPRPQPWQPWGSQPR